MKQNQQNDNVSVKSKGSIAKRLPARQPVQTLKQDQKSQASGTSQKKAPKPQDFITPTPGEGLQPDLKKSQDKSQKQEKQAALTTNKISRFLPLQNDQMQENNIDDLEADQNQQGALMILDDVQINNYNVPKYLKRDGTDQHQTGHHARNIRRLHREKRMKEMKTKIEEYIVPTKSKIYTDDNYYDDLKRKAQKLQELSERSEASFAYEYQKQDVLLQFACSYQISAFLPTTYLTRQMEDLGSYISPRMSHIQSDLSIRSSVQIAQQDKFLEFKGQVNNLNDSVQPFQPPVTQIKIVIPGDVEQILENDDEEDDADFGITQEQAIVRGIHISNNAQMKKKKSPQEMGQFPKPSVQFLPLSKNKPRQSQVLDIALNKDGQPIPQDELLPYNQQKIEEVARELFSSPPILRPLLSVDVTQIAIYQDNSCSLEQLQQFLFLNQSPSDQLLELYIPLQKIMQQIKTVGLYLSESSVNVNNEIIDTKSVLENLAKEIAKFSILCTKNDILKNSQWKEYITKIQVLQARMEINLKKIMLIISEIECNQVRKEEMTFENTLKLCKQRLTEANEDYEKFDQMFIPCMGNLCKGLRLNDFLALKQQGSADEQIYQQEAKLVKFLLGFPEMVKRKIEEAQQFVWLIYKFMMNQQEVQDELVRTGRSLLENFSNGCSSLLILYDFSVIKLEKINIKLKAICSHLLGIRLPYREYADSNDEIISEYLRSLQKLKSRDKTLLPSLLQLTFTPDLIEQINTLAGKHIILQEYIGYRNSVVKNPRKFNFNLIINRPMMLLQKMKEQIPFDLNFRLNQIDKRLESQFYQMTLIQGMYIFFSQIPAIEEELLQAQDLMGEVRNHIMKTDNQMIIRTQIADLQHQLIRLLFLREKLPLFKGFTNKQEQVVGLQEEAVLPQQITRMKEWIQVEIDQCQHIQVFLYEGLKFELENRQAVQESETKIVEQTQKGSKLMEQIKQIVQVEASPTMINFVRFKLSQPKAKQQQMPQPILTSPLSKDQELALQQIYIKYLEEQSEQQQEDEKTKLQIQRLKIIEQCDNILNELVQLKESSYVSVQRKVEISANYLLMSEMCQKYQIWEHMVATRYIMDPANLVEVIKISQLFPEPNQSNFPSYSIEVLLRKIKEHSSFFDINLNHPQSQYYRKHLADGTQLFQFFKNNFDLYKEMTDKNIKEPGTVQIEPLMAELNTKVEKFFKQKNSLLYMKEDLVKTTKYYIQQNTIQFKNSGKAATLNTKFEEIKPQVVSFEKLVGEAAQLIQKIYDIGLVEALMDTQSSISFKEEAEEGRKMALEEMISKTDLYQALNEARQFFQQTYDSLTDFKATNDLKQMQSHEQALNEQIQLLGEILKYLDIFDKTLQVAYDCSYDLIEDLKVVQKKQSYFLAGLENTSGDFEDVNQKEHLSFIKDIAQRLIKNVKSLREADKQSPFRKEIESREKRATEPVEIKQPPKNQGKQIQNQQQKQQPQQQQLYIVKFRKGKVIDEVSQISQKIAKHLIDLLENIYGISYQFLEIDAGFAKYEHEIELQKSDFFEAVNQWIFFFTNKDRPGVKQLEGVKPLGQMIPICQDRLKNLPSLSSKIYGALKEAVESLISTVNTYQNYLNKDFMIALSDFGNKFHVGEEKVQDFQSFVDDLQYALTPREDNKEGVKLALRNFFEKNKKSEEPLRRMTLFYKTMIRIKSDNRMQKQYILKRIRDINSLHERMGGQRGESWIKLCQNMQSCLGNYLQDVELAQLKNYKHYTQKIEENAVNDEDKDLKRLVSQFVKLIEKDHELSKVYNK